ncbi:MAG: signal peptide peptidase SppA [Candidatus Cloacimonadaceae bacterium]|jgi:protease-4|nr:signal peptide peptidase SppA [Candidatus Cloacimonadota bacterium]MDY0128073.1 signal peptide peptidase SppA [Candidatus Cloacimonadaceae bacterium]MCB5255686.1 signal peptide peptidase SppA [Candidatus Cloacimonadota bacterium]MCK9178507.1 signal peptide peptidase SppA [Candidatus Cloacimonadota bacterium]MCK9242591.1 signal peptide peptidase SppA [Candidatus Cloacimonadota bacterium]
MSTKKIVLIAIIVFILLVGLSYCVGRQMSKFAFSGPGPTPISADSWLNLNLSAFVPEYNEVLPLNLFGSKSANSMQNISYKIRRAKDDSRISGLLIQPMAAQISLAALHEIGLAIQDFKSSGKPVIAFGDMMGHGDYLLATYADEIYMEPSASAGLMLSGVSTNIMFYKEMFEKIGIKMHIIQAGEFKGAGEPYSQTSLSEGTRRNIEEMLSDRFELILSGVAERRGLTIDDVKAVYNGRENFILQAKEALEMRLIDHAAPRNQMLAERLIDEDNIVSISSYSTRPPASRGEKIAVMYLGGNIMPVGGSFNQALISYSKVHKMVEQVQDDNAVKAVVLRIDSPGGSALESELIYQELLKLKSSKPLVVSMGGVAASGGYYISCASDQIIADAGSITGSIGVIMMLPEATGLGRKLGLRSQTIKFGKFAGGLNPLEPYSEELLASLKRNSEGTYDEFKSRVMTARKISPDKINSIAEGRIYSAEDALALGLVDNLGSLEYAIAKAAELAGISDYRVENYPHKLSFFEAIKSTDFLNMQLSSLMGSKWWDLDREIIEELEMIEPYKWQYLMPIVVD